MQLSKLLITTSSLTAFSNLYRAVILAVMVLARLYNNANRALFLLATTISYYTFSSNLLLGFKQDLLAVQQMITLMLQLDLY